jgi:hypothetical protein
MKFVGEQYEWKGGDFWGTGREIKRNGFKTGDEIYAAAYRLNSTKTSNALKCLPVKGVFSCSKYEDVPVDDTPDIRYFIPYGKSGKLLFSKAVDVDSRQYATTYEEAVEVYNKAISNVAEKFEELKQQTLANKI